MKKYIIFLVLCIVFLIVILGYGISKLRKDNNYLTNRNQNIVFDYYKSEKLKQTIPHVNIKKVDTEINKSIDTFMKPFIEKKTVTTNYHYHINGSIFTLFIFITDNNNDRIPMVHFKEFHVDLKKLKILTNDDILKIFNYKEEEIIEQLNNKFKKFYNDERRKRIIPSDTTFEVFVKSHLINSWKDILHYDIIEKDLYACIEYSIYPELEKSFYKKQQGVGYCFKVPIE